MKVMSKPPTSYVSLPEGISIFWCLPSPTSTMAGACWRLHRHLGEVRVRRDAGADGSAAQIRCAEPLGTNCERQGKWWGCTTD